MSDELSIKARVIDFKENAMHRHFRHSDLHVFDATVLQILAPPELAGNRLCIYHDKHEKIDSIWHKLDAILTFKLNAKTFKTNDTLYTGAVKELSEHVSI